MKTVLNVVFEERERYVFGRLLGMAQALGEDVDGKSTLGRHLRAAVPSRSPIGGADSEPFNEAKLEAFHDALEALATVFSAQTTVEWWEEAGAPGPRETLEGLARERQIQVEMIDEGIRILDEALGIVGAG